MAHKTQSIACKQKADDELENGVSIKKQMMKDWIQKHSHVVRGSKRTQKKKTSANASIQISNGFKKKREWEETKEI